MMMNETQNEIALTLILGVNDNENLGNAILNTNPVETNRSKSHKNCVMQYNVDIVKQSSIATPLKISKDPSVRTKVICS